MLAKIAVWGRDREEARCRMLRALEECLIYGVKSNIQLHKLILGQEKYIKGDISTDFIAELGELNQPDSLKHDLAIIAAICGKLYTAPDKKDSVSPDSGQGADLWRMASKYQFWASRF
jgi:acetyl/propionyl-CoA carboxylase alpha subunit